MDNKKFRLEDVSKEEQDSFQKDLNALLEKGSFYFEPVPQYQRITIKNAEGQDALGWTTINSFLLQKKVEVAEVVKEGEIVSPLSDELTNESPKAD